MSNDNTIYLHNQTECMYTQVSNTFIDEYMPEASGTFIKVYLTLLRLMGDSHLNISIEHIANALDLTNKQVTKALAYWEKNGLLMLTRDEKDNIKDITFNTPSKSTSEVIKTYTTSELNEITSKEDFLWIVNILEKYMQRNLTPTDIDVVAYLYDSLHFSPDLIFYLYEYCIGKGKKNSKYIQAVALNWAKEGVDSVEKASARLTEYDSRYMEVMRTFGLSQAPAPIQKQYIDTWLSYGFDISMIKEACSRTVAAIGSANFKYANGIIEKWIKQGIKNIDDIKKADNIHLENVKSNPSPRKKINNSFNSYEQRSYSGDDYSSLEHKLLSK